LEKIRRLACKITDKLNSGGFLFLEIGQGQAGGVTTFLHSLFPASMIEVIPDLSGIERVVSLNLR
jgi:methylase of polypeptide subunit release factors